MKEKTIEMMELLEKHEEAMEKAAQGIANYIFDQFPHGISMAQINILFDEAKDIIQHMRVRPAPNCKK